MYISYFVSFIYGKRYVYIRPVTSLFLFLLRDTLIYATSVEARGMPEAVRILSEVILRPKLEQEEVGT